MSGGVDHRPGLDLALLWLWCRPVAIALIRSLTWEPPFAAGAALENRPKKKNFFLKLLKKKLINENIPNKYLI